MSAFANGVERCDVRNGMASRKATSLATLAISEPSLTDSLGAAISSLMVCQVLETMGGQPPRFITLCTSYLSWDLAAPGVNKRRPLRPPVLREHCSHLTEQVFGSTLQACHTK